MIKSKSTAKEAVTKMRLTAVNKIRRIKKMIAQGARLQDRLSIWESK